jgi:excisionase family DNA binding protein
VYIQNMKMLTTREAADKLGVSDTRIRQMILSGRLPASQFGKAHVIKEDDLKLVADRKPGRPAKVETAKAKKAK